MLSGMIGQHALVIQPWDERSLKLVEPLQALPISSGAFQNQTLDGGLRVVAYIRIPSQHVWQFQIVGRYAVVLLLGEYPQHPKTPCAISTCAILYRTLRGRRPSNWA
jgi:hypothetical protein